MTNTLLLMLPSYQPIPALPVEKTAPPLEITSELNEPLSPIPRTLALVQTDPLSVTKTLLEFADEPSPILPHTLKTVPLLLIVMELPEPK